MRGKFLAGLAVALAGVCSGGNAVRLGMEPRSVIAVLGSPDRRAILVGKELRDVTQVPGGETDTQSRLVYIYDSANIRVWFSRGKVTGLTKDGLAVSEVKAK